jgi:thioesterase domain-containing protein/acyl carrier protein
MNCSNLSTSEQKALLVSLLSEKPLRMFPLSLAQQRLWFLDQLYPGNSAYNVPFGYRLQGELDRDALELSIVDLIQRHEILRTTFAPNAGYPLQIVTVDPIIDIPFLDLIGMSANERQSVVYRVGMEEARLPFNLETGPLLRLKLIRLDQEEHLLLCVMHHIICDGWSLEIFVRELGALYEQHTGGPKAFLPDLPVQYGDYAKWQREWIAGDILADQAQYWKQKLAGAPPFLDLPSDHSRPAEQAHNGASQTIPLPNELVHHLENFAHGSRATLFMAMLAVFKTLIHSYTGNDDVLVGIPAAGRNLVEIEDLIGFFANTLVLRTNLSGDPSFSELLFRVREVALDAFAHADFPFEKLVEDLNPPRTLSYSPVIQVMFSFVKVRKLPSFRNVSVSPYVFSSHKSLFDLAAEFIQDAEDRCWLRVEYDTALFDHARIAKMLNDYLMLLQVISAQPDLHLSKLTLLLKPGQATQGNAPITRHQETNRTAALHRVAQKSYSDDKEEPHDALEKIILRIWKRVLGISKIGVHDNFFDLGGHSLLAAQLVSEVEKVVGHQIPISSLFHGSTIASFAEMIRSSAEWNPDPLVMELNAGTQGFPVFAVVQPGVDALGYALLARHMGAEQSFYKLQAPASYCLIRVTPFSIEEYQAMAREYIAAMQMIQPGGPYFLIGMCNGAHIAEQMILELEARGHEVGFLAILDTFVLQHSEIRWLAQIEAFRLRRQCIAQLPISIQISHYKQAVSNHLRRIFSHEPQPPSQSDKAFWPGKEFQPKQFRAPLILFKRPKQPYFKIKDPKMGWAARSLSEIKICTVNGGAHMEILREPSVQAIAEQLATSLCSFQGENYTQNRQWNFSR